MDILGFIALTITGFTACAEFGSYAFVHPVIRQLPPEHHIRVEQGFLKTFARDAGLDDAVRNSSHLLCGEAE
ncbi:hypothetical protein BH20ACI3_BH20ACI3_22780 [soil metagenome]